MFRFHRLVVLAAVVSALVAIAVPALAQQPAAADPPSTKDPIRFTAVAKQTTGGMSAAMITFTIERWTTDAERNALIALVPPSSDLGTDRRLVDALQAIKPRAGFLRGQNTSGYDIKYARENTLSDGSRQVVIITDKPVSFLAATASTRSKEYMFTLIEMRFPAGGDKGEGKMLGQSSISTKDGKLQIELYTAQPTVLTTITQEKRKNK